MTVGTSATPAHPPGALTSDPRPDRAHPRRAGRRPAGLGLLGLLVACTPQTPVVYGPAILPPVSGPTALATPRVNGELGAPNALPRAEVSYGGPASRAPTPPASSEGGSAGPGTISIDFADTDIREVVAHILGTVLKVNYTIDPSVKGTATFHTAQPMTPMQVLTVLQSLLAQDGAAIVQSGDLYRVIPASAAAAIPGVADSPVAGGSVIVPLQYVSADDLAKVLQPIAGPAVRVTPDPTRNAIVITGSPETRGPLVTLVRSFDVNTLAGQSYALFPVPQGSDAKEFASALQDAFRGGGGPGTGVRVLPLNLAASVLVVARDPAGLDAARRVYALIERRQGATVRSWHVYYLQNSHANDVAYLLQRAFTPNDVTAPPPGATTARAAQSGAQLNPPAAGAGTATTGGAIGGNTGAGAMNLLAQGGGEGGAPPAAGASTASAPAAAGNPLLGGLEPSSGSGGGDAMRIIPNPQNNAVLIYATRSEEDTVEAMLRKVDILPLQVRIDATIAEVSLNDALRYGTQFFFKEGSVNETLSSAASSAFASTFPGFVLNASARGVDAALSALQAVTTVHVLSSPEVMVLDNQPATLQVGDLVPYLTQSSQSTLVAGSPVINSINYRQTGVILKVTPRVNSGGLVTLDIAQEVSGIDQSAPQYQGISSPTFSEREIESRVVVQDGQTVGLAGLITDNIGKTNSGIPFLKDVPILGFLTGSQSNQRNRTELLVMITPHVVQDARDARALAADLQNQLPNAAAVPAESLYLGPTGRANPNGRVLRSLGMPQ